MDTNLPETEIDRAARELGIVPGDPSYAFVMGMRKLMREHREETAEQLSEVRALIDKAREQPFRQQDIDRLVTEAGKAASVAADALHHEKAAQEAKRLWFGIAAGWAASVIVALLIGYGVRWQSEGPAEYVGIRTGPDVCEERPNGKLCNIPVFLPKRS